MINFLLVLSTIFQNSRLVPKPRHFRLANNKKGSSSPTHDIRHFNQNGRANNKKRDKPDNASDLPISKQKEEELFAQYLEGKSQRESSWRLMHGGDKNKGG